MSWTGKLVVWTIRDADGRVVRTQTTTRVGHNLLVVSVLSPRKDA